MLGEQTNKLQERKDIPEHLTWDLTTIFVSEEEWEREYKALEADIPSVQAYQGKIGESADTFYELFDLQDKLSDRLGRLYTYSHLKSDEDTANTHYQSLNQRAQHLITRASSMMSFIVPEILTID